MPLYDFRCPMCLTVQRDVFAHMEVREVPCECGSTAERLISTPRIGGTFKSGYYEHISDEPIYVKTKADLRHICADHNCTSDYAEN